MNQIVLPFATLEYKEPILYIRFKENVVLDVNEVNAISEVSEKVTMGKPRLVLTDARIPVDITPAGRRASANAKNRHKVIASAIIVKWLGQRLIVDVYNMLNKPQFPMKVFTEEDTAVKWLLKQKKTVPVLREQR